VSIALQSLIECERTYQPRRSTEGVLHQLVRENLETFLAEGALRSRSGLGYPRFVETEFRQFLQCGDLTHGFVRVRCTRCRQEVLVPLSCKNRGICPSCTGRRMAEEAAYLVDMVLPEARFRQWTVTFPFEVRFLMARDHRVITALLGLAVRLIFTWQRRQAKRAGAAGGKPAAVGFVQRFGGALNSNVHVHLLVPDGVFVTVPDEEQLRLLPLSAPETCDLEELIQRLVERSARILAERFGLFEVEQALGGAEEESLEQVISEAMQTGSGRDESEPRPRPRCAELCGFTIHAATSVAPGDRRGLERLCSYGLRPPFSQDNLSQGDDGRVHLRLKRPRRDGTKELVFEPVAFLRRLSALVPPPYAHLIRYYGLFAPHAEGRELLPAAPVDQGLRPSVALRADLDGRRSSKAPGDGDDKTPARRVLSWAELLKRVFAIEALVCQRCHGPMKVIALVTERTVVMAILRHLGMPTSSPPISPARMAAQGELFDDGWNVAPSRKPQHASSREQIRGPPFEEWVEYDPTSDQWDA